ERHRDQSRHLPGRGRDSASRPGYGRHTPLPVPDRGFPRQRGDAADLPAPVRRQRSRIRDPCRRAAPAHLRAGAGSPRRARVADLGGRRLHRLLLLRGGARCRGPHRQGHRGSAHLARDGGRCRVRIRGRPRRAVRGRRRRRGRATAGRRRGRRRHVPGADPVHDL
ncbi:MAG: Alkaline phosphatase, partial [uncultured Rubrobacteraceae bacterium]